MLPKLYDNQDCSLARALEVVGERWSLLIVRDAFYGVARFGEFQGHLGIPRAVLADRLRALEACGVLVREPDPQHSGRHRYRLTEKGAALWPALYALREWGEAYYAAAGGARRVFQHAQCDTCLGPRGECTRCGEVVPAHDVVVAPGPGLARKSGSDPVSRALRAPHRLGTPLDFDNAATVQTSALHAG